MNLLQKLLISTTSLISPKVKKYLITSIFFGFLWFSLETVFILILQVFLYSLGLLKIESINVKYIPDFVLSSTSISILAFIIFGLLRSFILTCKEYTTGLALHTFIENVRTRILKIGFNLGEQLNTHDVVTAFNEQVTKSGSYIKNLSNLAQSFTTFIFLLSLGILLAPKELILGLVLLIIIFSPVKFLYDHVQKMGAYLTTAYSDISKHLLMGLKNNFFLKVFKLIPSEVERGEKKLFEYESHYKKHVLMMSLKSSLPLFLGFFIVGFVCWIGIHYWNSHPATLLSFFYLFLRITQSMSDMNNGLSNLKLNQNSFETLTTWVTNNEKLLQNLTDKKLVKYNSAIHSIAVDHLSFGYNSNNLLFTDLNFKLNLGDSLVIKGHSGAGKSTLLKLILGLENPTSGKVYINSDLVNAGEIDISDDLAYVGPDPFLIPGTIRENIQFGSQKKYSDEEIWEALEKAKLNEFVFSKREKLNLVLTEYANLSTGQKQRLALARAFCRNPKILILDEATANLDPVTEKEIIDTITANKQNMISLIISHKDSFDELATQKIELGKRSS